MSTYPDPPDSGRWRRALLLAAGAVVALAVAPQALAFDTGAHAEITQDALTAEGFGSTAVEVTQVNNWFNDVYENAKKNPFSGHGGFWKTLIGGGLGASDDWPQALVDAADRTHFDATNIVFFNSAAINVEWDRLRRTTYKLVRSARDRNDPLAALTVLGISLHQVQDFYTHTNWVEPARPPGYDGPGWAAKGYGATPTWFDVPAAVRESASVYAGGSLGIRRSHGGWKSDGNVSHAGHTNKDWEGRPYYLEAYLAAYFATRQWVQAVRSWVDDTAFWSRVVRYANRADGALAHDLRGMLDMSLYAGHWKGQGEPCQPELSFDFCGDASGPGGSLEDLGIAVGVYFRGRPKTVFRGTWERYVMLVGERFPAGPVLGTIPSSQPLQRSTWFTRLRVTQLDEIDDRDLGALNQADWYVDASIGGQRYRSATIFGEDHFGFSLPNYPFTFLKAAPRGSRWDEPLTSLRVEVRTSDVANAGTDDDVYLRINGTQRFQLDKDGYDDFERGRRDTYSAPIDAAFAAGLSVGDIERIQVEKSPDGSYGGWKLGGVKVVANGRVIYANDAVERWLEDSSRTWTAAGFVPRNPRGAALPVWLRLMDDDGVLTGDDDHCDIDAYASRKDLALAFDTHGPGIDRTIQGAGQLGGRDGDEAKLRYRMETIVPQPASVVLAGA
jgi:hypothetical protein